MTPRLPLTRARVLALVIGAPLALAIIGWTGVTWVAYAAQASYPVRLDLPVPGHTVTVSVDSGNLTVGQTAGGRLLVTGTAHYSLVRSRVTQRATRSGLTVSSSCRFPMGVCDFTYLVGVPTGVRAFLSDSSGDIRFRGLAGYVHASDDSGQIVGTGVSGPRTVLADGSGDINVGELTSADVVATDGSGNITLIFTKVPGRVSVSDGSGDVHLVLPPGPTPYRVKASMSFGSPFVNVPTSSVSPHVIRVTDGSGDITITH
jgi:hypothetical protein